MDIHEVYEQGWQNGHRAALRDNPVRTRALISVELDHRQYRALMSLAQEYYDTDLPLWRYEQIRESALNLRRQAQFGAWILSGRWPVRTATEAAAATAA